MPVLRRHLLLLLPLLFAALWLRGLTPAGWMPGPDGVTLTMCGADTVAHGPDGKADGKPPTGDQPCVFAAMTAIAGDGTPQLPLPLVVLVAIAAAATLTALRLPRRHRPRPPSQGPPGLQPA